MTQAGDDLRRAVSDFKTSKFIGAAILVFALVGMAACSGLMLLVFLPAWACVILVVIFASLTHELEHDLIHYMYFKKTPWAHHLMLALEWLASSKYN